MKKELSDAELETYARQIVLEDIGYDGQLRLRNARACIIGMGGLGTLISLKMVGMGIGYLRMVDRDIVSRSDLHRQHLYDVDSVGQPKVEVAARKLGRLNPDVELDPCPESLNSINAEELIKDMDVVLDGLDRPEPRYIVNRTCNKFNVPYVFGAAIQTLGNTTTIIPGKSLCLECFMPGLTEDDLPKCGVVGVHPSSLGIITAVQAYEAARVVMGKEPLLLNELLYVDLGDMKFNTLKLKAREDCPVCGPRPKGSPEPIRDKFYEETCARDGRRNFVLTPKNRIEIDIRRVEGIINQKGYTVKTRGSLGLTFIQPRDVVASILKSGTMIVQTPPTLTEDYKGEALGIYRGILVDGLGFSPDILPEE
ncbi:MAG: HesA/MoeB/ThiF family protein [Deltaproteobacteria bacterium]|nr:HesA/MoeB/ThiF family protein [Deltaproteobacteria bacterium]